MLNTHLWFTLRALRKSPGFALAAILTIGLGIGSSTTIFSGTGFSLWNAD